jgi:chemotaxis protein MotB
LSRVSGGGDGSFGGESVFSEDQIAQNGTGASSLKPSEEMQAAGQTGTERQRDAEAKGRFEEEARRIEEALMGVGGESMVSEEALRHIVTRVTDEGLIVELHDVVDRPLFEPGTSVPAPITTELAGVVARVFRLVLNEVAVGGHIAAQPEVLRENPAWDLSSARAMQMRLLVEAAGLPGERIQRVAGYADRKPVVKNPLALRNNRIEIVLLRPVK